MRCGRFRRAKFQTDALPFVHRLSAPGARFIPGVMHRNIAGFFTALRSRPARQMHRLLQAIINRFSTGYPLTCQPVVRVVARSQRVPPSAGPMTGQSVSVLTQKRSRPGGAKRNPGPVLDVRRLPGLRCARSGLPGDGPSRSEPHPEERAFARVSKDGPRGLMVRDARLRGLLTMRVFLALRADLPPWQIKSGIWAAAN
jgi:hypothetical protein